MLEGLSPKERALTCRVRSVLAELDQEDRTILENALADSKTWGAKTLEKALKTRGITLSDNSITKHRTGICSCLRD